MRNARLILSAIPDDFDPSKDIPISPACFLGREHIVEGWENLPFEDPLGTPEDKEKAENAASAQALSLLHSVYPELNKAQNLTYSDKFWGVVLMPYLVLLTEAVFERYLRFEKTVERYAGQELYVEVVGDVEGTWEFADMADFMNRGIRDVDFSEWLYSRFIEANPPPRWEIRRLERRINPAPEQLSPARTGWLRNMKEVFLSCLRVKNVYGFTPVSTVLFSIYLSLLPSKKCAVPPAQVVPAVDEKMGKKMQAIDFLSLARKTIPLCYKEIGKIEKKAVHHFPLRKEGKINLICGNILYDENNKIALGLALEAGECIISSQHGGGYGTLRSLSSVTFWAEYRHFAFITWGWGEHQDYHGSFLRLPSPYMNRFWERHRKSSESLVMVGTVINVLGKWLGSEPQAARRVVYRRQKLAFIDALGQQQRRVLKYRPYFDTKGALKDRGYVESAFPGIGICAGDLHSQMFSCKLLVLDHPGTTLNIAMAANTPTVCFWDKTDWAMCRQAQPFFDALEKAGILYYSPVDAARHINKVWDDVDAWWHRRDVREAREQWIQQYAKQGKFWWCQWMKALWKL